MVGLRPMTGGGRGCRWSCAVGWGGGERNEGLVDSLVRLMGEHGLAVPVQGLGGLLATYMPGNAVDLAGWNKQMLDVLDPDVGDQLTRVIGFRLQVFDVRDDGSVLAHAGIRRWPGREDPVSGT